MPSPRPTEARPLLSAARSAAFGFLCALAAGALLLVAAKLQVPDLGAGASPITILETIVLVALGSLGTPIDIGRVEVVVLPLGSVAAVCAGISWATRAGLMERGTARSWARAASDATYVAVVLGILCAAAALLVTVGAGSAEVSARPWAAGLAGAGWGFVAALAGARPEWLKRFLPSLRRGTTPPGAPGWSEGLRSSAWLAAVALLGVVALGTVRILFRSGSAAGVLGSLIHGLAFAPNLAAAGVAVALGGSVEAELGGLAADGSSAAGYSLFDWAAAPAPAPAWILPLASAACVLLLGIALARRAGQRSEVGWSRRILEAAGAGLTFAASLSVLALAGDARAGEVDGQGFVRLAPDALQVLWLGLVWAAAGIVAGGLLWRFVIGKRRERER